MATEKNAQAQKTEDQSNQQQKPQQSGSMQTGGQGRQGRELAHGRSYSPSAFLLRPHDIFTASPFELMRRFSDQMDRMFEDFGLSAQGRSRTSGGSQMGLWVPAVEVIQREGNLVVRAELPGLNKEDVKLELTDEGLVIQGERKQEHEETGEGFYRSERSYGRFYRVIPLPEEIEPEQVRAQFNNGVLEVTIPITQGRQTRREITIGAEGGEKSQAASRSTK